MKISDIEVVLGMYIKNEVIPNIPNTPEKFMIAVGSSLIALKGEKLIQQYMPLLKTMDVVDESGDVDIDMLHNVLTNSLETIGGKLDIRGLIFNKADLDKLYSMLKEAKVGK